MKKYLSIALLTIACMSIALFYFSCKKTNQGVGEKNNTAVDSRPKKGVLFFPSANASPTARIIDSVDISADGYLIFPSGNVLESYRLYLVGHTHSVVQAYLNLQGFSSYGTTIYTRAYQSQTITDEQAADYLLSANLLVKIGKVIYRPRASASCTTVKWDFVLTMDESNVTPKNLGDLISGTYDIATMNQFATNPASDSDFTVDEYMRITPTGHQETTANTCPSSIAARPMFGHGGWSNTSCTLDNPNNWTDHDGDGDTDPTYIQCRHRREYVFWIGTGWDNDCYVAYSCN